MTSSLEGHVALITGAGRGIGRHHALLLAERGAKVVCNDLGVELDGSGRDVSVASDVVREVTAAGGEAIADTSDISAFSGGSAAVETGVRAFGFVDIVVNNAGTASSLSISDVTEDLVARQLAVHLYGAIGTAKAAWPIMRERGWGRVINTVSEAAFPSRITAGQASGLGYGPAKAAVWSATHALAVEGKPFGITVNGISPGAFTRMNEAMFEDSPSSLDLDPCHVARVVAWLASSDADDVTGVVIHAAGGQHREYRVERHRDTELMARIRRALQG